MKFCSNCGTELDPSAKFCTSCGAPVNFSAGNEPDDMPKVPEAAENAEAPQSAEAPQYAAGAEPAVSAENSGFAPTRPLPAEAPYAPAPKKSKRKAGIIALVCGIALLAVTASLLIALRLFGSPADEFVSLHKDAYITPLSEGIASLSKRADGKGNADFSTDMTLRVSGDASLLGDEEQEFFNKLALDIKLDGSGKSTLLGLKVRYEDSELNGTFTSDGDNLGFYLPELDENYYTVSSDKLTELLGGEFSRLFIGSGVSVPGADALNTLSAEDTQRLIDDIGEIMFSCVNKSNVTKSKKDVYLSYSNETVRCTVYTFTPTERDLETMLKRLAAYLEDSDAAYELFVSLLSAGSPYGAYYPYGSYYQGDDYFKDLYDSFVSSFSRGANDFAGELYDAGFVWSTAVKGKRIYSDRISIRRGKQELSLSYESFGDGKKSRSDALIISADGDNVTFASEYTRGRKNLSGKLIFDSRYEQGSVEYDFDTSKRSALGIYYGEIIVRADGERVMKLTVEKGKSGGSVHTLDIYSSDGKMNLILTSTDKKSTVKAPNVKAVDLSESSEREIYEIIQDMSYELQALLKDLPPFSRRGDYNSSYGSPGYGYQQGFGDAYNEGYDDGYEDGYEDGRNNDYYGYYYGESYEAYEFDYSEEYSNGYNNGYEAGYNDGL